MGGGSYWQSRSLLRGTSSSGVGESQAKVQEREREGGRRESERAAGLSPRSMLRCYQSGCLGKCTHIDQYI